MKTTAYVLNLDRVPERAAHMAQQCAAAGIQWHRFSAVDAKDPDWRPPSRYRPERWSAPYWTLTTSEVAVMEGHRAIWKRIAEAGRPAVIFEDDILISPSAGHIISTLALAAEQFDMVKLDGVSRTFRLGPECRLAGFSARSFTHILPSAAAYLLTPRGAHILVERSTQYCDHVDDFITRNHPNYRAYQLVPAIAVQCMFADLSALADLPVSITESERTDGGRITRSKNRGPFLYRLSKELKRGSRRLARRLWADHTLVTHGGFIGEVPLTHDLPPYRHSNLAPVSPDTSEPNRKLKLSDFSML